MCIEQREGRGADLGCGHMGVGRHHPVSRQSGPHAASARKAADHPHRDRSSCSCALHLSSSRMYKMGGVIFSEQAHRFPPNGIDFLRSYLGENQQPRRKSPRVFRRFSVCIDAILTMVRSLRTLRFGENPSCVTGREDEHESPTEATPSPPVLGASFGHTRTHFRLLPALGYRPR